ncbi:MAG: type II secretion system GspH family protein [Gallionellaceae bacterium]|nr:type II secretion system GspH family protein [Gallionellaceae bacterium]
MTGNRAQKTDNYPRFAQPAECGFTLIELVVTIAIVSVLAGILLNRVGLYQEQAEKAAMIEVASAIQTALVLQQGHLMARGAEAEITALATSNPMSLLAKQPPNYSGEFYDPSPQSVAPGHWFFDLKARELVYVLNRNSHFDPGPDEKNWVRYRVNLADDTRNSPSKPSQNLTGVIFEPTKGYRWLGN